jgi:magnesium-transporting ATPase (P-type)
MLPTVTLSLAMGVQRMAGRGALIKRLSSVETLGSTTVIGTDKTGTLTQNEMTVREIWLGGRRLTVTGGGYTPTGEIREADQVVSARKDGDLHQLLTAAGLCNNARLLPPDEEHSQWTILGDPTEAALLVTAPKSGVDLDEENRRLPRLRELPFDSRRKRMATIHQVGGERVVYVKGAPREVLALCDTMLLAGQTIPLDETHREAIAAANDEYARDGLRVLAIASRDLRERLSEYTPELIERQLTFIGLMAMMDPPRPEVADAVEKCHTAGIRIIMITGDYGLTAETIARRIGIIQALIRLYHWCRFG